MTLSVYRKLDVLDLCRLVSTPEEMLQVFVNFYKHKPPQGSLQWKKDKEGSIHLPPTIGGSEIGTVLKINKYQNIKQLIASKLGLTKFSGNVATRWGNLFEDVLFGITDVLFKTRTCETGSIPGIKDDKGNVIQSYSPDRIGVITRKDFIQTIKDVSKIMDIKPHGKVPNKEKLIVLMEGKCPLTRIPTSSIPEQYTLQPQLGAATIKIVDTCLFVDGMFRKCSISDFGLSPDHDNNFHKVSEPATAAIAGFIGIYRKENTTNEEVPAGTCQNIDNIISDLKMSVLSDVSEPGSDFYGVDPHSINNLMSLCVICDRYLDTVYNNYDDSIYLNKKDEESITISVLKKLIIDEEHHHLIDLIVPDALSANYKQSEYRNSEGYKIDNAGIDYGYADITTFSGMLRDVIDNRHTDDGCKAYYPEAFYVDERLKPSFTGEQNYQDVSENDSIRPKKWLHRNVRKYTDWCRDNGCVSVGIIPWKLFKLSYLPSAIIPNFIETAKPKILEVVNVIESIKQLARDVEPSQAADIIRDEFEKRFPTKRRPKQDKKSDQFIIGNVEEFIREIEI